MTNKQTKSTATEKKAKWCFFIGVNRICSIIKTLAILLILLGVSMMINQSIQEHKILKEYETLMIFSTIDDIAHAQFAEMEASGNPHNWTGTDEFLWIDDGYHNAKTTQDKYERAKEMNDFAIGVANWLQAETGRLDSPADIARYKKFQDVEVLLLKLFKK